MLANINIEGCSTVNLPLKHRLSHMLKKSLNVLKLKYYSWGYKQKTLWAYWLLLVVNIEKTRISRVESDDDGVIEERKLKEE